MHAVVTATVPRRSASQVFEQMRVRVFDTEDAAQQWAVENPHYITEVVPVEVIPGDTPTWHVEDNVTGARASRNFDTLTSANGTCYSLNLDAGPGGRYGVYDHTGQRVAP